LEHQRFGLGTSKVWFWNIKGLGFIKVIGVDRHFQQL
jgi:hypothetical protein